jgi:hypothetical protein
VATKRLLLVPLRPDGTLGAAANGAGRVPLTPAVWLVAPPSVQDSAAAASGRLQLADRRRRSVIAAHESASGRRLWRRNNCDSNPGVQQMLSGCPDACHPKQPSPTPGLRCSKQYDKHGELLTSPSPLAPMRDPMRRREFIAVVGDIAACSPAALAQAVTILEAGPPSRLSRFSEAP